MGLLDHIRRREPPAEPPESIDVRADGSFELVWPGGKRAALPAFRLRDACPCAGCIEEGTGRKILDTATIPPDVRPTRVDPVGNYAVQIHWSDGHSSGIYTWQTLRELCGP